MRTGLPASSYSKRLSARARARVRVSRVSSDARLKTAREVGAFENRGVAGGNWLALSDTAKDILPKLLGPTEIS